MISVYEYNIMRLKKGDIVSHTYKIKKIYLFGYILIYKKDIKVT